MPEKMELLPMERLGAREISVNKLQFGIFLPGVSGQDKIKMWVNIIHEKDQYLQNIPALCFEMKHSPDQRYGDYWSAAVAISKKVVDAKNRKPSPASRWGEKGKYLYWYSLEAPSLKEPLNWIIDPYAREFGEGKMSSITLGYKDYEWSENETDWKTPGLRELVVYELMLSEFAGGLDAAISKLDYLQDLGINCIEVMPVSNVADVVNWGYWPIGYFGVDERFGNRKNFQKLVDEAHQRGIAIIVDLVYGHTSDDFAYAYVYNALGRENPFIGDFEQNQFGQSTDFRKQLTRDYFFSVNNLLLDKCHIDGFRYDCVPEYYDGPMGKGYADLVYSTYMLVKENNGQGYWQRFFRGNEVNLIQCAEYIDDPKHILEKTYSNCAWQNVTLGLAANLAQNPSTANIEALGRDGFGLEGFPAEIVHNSDTIAKAPFQYLENHDQPRFICNFDPALNTNDLTAEADRWDYWFKLQPYLIGIFTAKGIPFLWQGQEFCENYFIPQTGFGRVKMFRPVRWDYFYDQPGRNIIRLVRALIKLRNGSNALKYGEHYFYNDYYFLAKKLLLFHRKYNNEFTLVALNFGDMDQEVFFKFETTGDYIERLIQAIDNKIVSFSIPSAGEMKSIRVPSNYGTIWTCE